MAISIFGISYVAAGYLQLHWFKEQARKRGILEVVECDLEEPEWDGCKDQHEKDQTENCKIPPSWVKAGQFITWAGVGSSEQEDHDRPDIPA